MTTFLTFTVGLLSGASKYNLSLSSIIRSATNDTSVCVLCTMYMYMYCIYMYMCCISFSLSLIFSSQNHVFLSLMEPCSRAIVFSSQVLNGMWRRNGYSVQNQAINYQHHSSAEIMYKKDIVMLQVRERERGNIQILKNCLF